MIVRSTSLVRLVFALFAGIAAALGLLIPLPREVDAKRALTAGRADHFELGSADCQIADGSCQREDSQVNFDGITFPAERRRQAWLTAQILDSLSAGVEIVRSDTSLTSASSQIPSRVEGSDTDPSQASADLSVAVTHAPSLFSPGRVMTYTVTYGNAGGMDAHGVVISATLPVGTVPTPKTLETWDSSDGVTYTYVVGGDGELVAGEVGRSVFFSVRHPDLPQVAAPRFSTRFTIAATESTGGDADPNNNSVDHVVGVPDLTITDLEVAPWPLEPNVPVVFTITVKNQGTGWAWNPDTIAPYWADVFLDPVSSYPFDRYSPRGIAAVCPILAPGEEFELAISEVYPWSDDWRGPIEFTQEEIDDIVSFYAKIDNFDNPPYGLVPEYNEENNVWPALSEWLYLPLVVRTQ